MSCWWHCPTVPVVVSGPTDPTETSRPWTSIFYITHQVGWGGGPPLPKCNWHWGYAAHPNSNMFQRDPVSISYGEGQTDDRWLAVRGGLCCKVLVQSSIEVVVQKSRVLVLSLLTKHNSRDNPKLVSPRSSQVNVYISLFLPNFWGGQENTSSYHDHRHLTKCLKFKLQPSKLAEGTLRVPLSQLLHVKTSPGYSEPANRSPPAPLRIGVDGVIYIYINIYVLPCLTMSMVNLGFIV